jgi:hypothetical protein
MPGGSWTISSTTDPGQRPSLYVNLQAKAAALISGGLTGVVAMAVSADWGPDKTPVSVTSEGDLTAKFGTIAGGGTAFYAIREALRGGAASVTAYRMETGAAAKAVRILQDGSAGTAITVTALYNGVRANNFTLDVVTNAVNGSAKDVKISEAGVLLETFTGLTNAAIVAQIMGTATGSTASKYVTAVAGGGTFVANVAGATMTGGNSGSVITGTEITSAMAALEPLVWDVFSGAGLAVGAFFTTLSAWIVGLRALGQRVMLVLGSATSETQGTAVTNAALYGASEGVVYVWPGVIDDLGTTRSGTEFSSRIAGLIASKGTNNSLTHASLPYISGLAQLPTNAEVKSALTGGVLLLTGDGRGGYQVEKGITTLVTALGVTPASFKKIRVVRICDSIINAISQAANQSYIGNILNNDVGQAIVLGAIKAFLDQLTRQNQVKADFTVTLDPANPSVGDRMFVLAGITPIDTADYIYLTINVGT